MTRVTEDMTVAGHNKAAQGEGQKPRRPFGNCDKTDVEAWHAQLFRPMQLRLSFFAISCDKQLRQDSLIKTSSLRWPRVHRMRKISGRNRSVAEPIRMKGQQSKGDDRAASTLATTVVSATDDNILYIFRH